MDDSWLKRFQTWFRTGARSVLTHQTKPFEQICQEDPQVAKEILATDQRELIEEFEKAYAEYERYAVTLSQRVATMDAKTISREASDVREAQDALRRMLHRVRLSVRTARELEMELSEWDQRSHEEGPRHANHPAVRAELVRSELDVRRQRSVLEVIPVHASPFRIVSLPDQPIDEHEPDELTHDATLSRLDALSLVQLIRLETREAERWHAIPQPAYEAIEQVRHLRGLHAHLKRLDRHARQQRDRLELAVHMRELHA